MKAFFRITLAKDQRSVANRGQILRIVRTFAPYTFLNRIGKQQDSKVHSS
jgi:hypothetical protein